jgi:integrase
MPIVNIVSRVPKEKLNNERDRILSEDEYIALKKELSDWLLPTVDFALETACRRSEILKIQLKHINFAERKIELLETKNGTNRTIYLSKQALQVLQDLYNDLTEEQKQDRETFLFKGTKNSISKCFATGCKKANIQDMTFHDLRHTAITLNLAPKIPNVLMLSKFTGHKTLSQLKRYYNPTDATLLELSDK